MAVSPLQWLRGNNEVFSAALSWVIATARKREGVNGIELNNGDVEIVLVAHPFVRVHAVSMAEL